MLAERDPEKDRVLLVDYSEYALGGRLYQLDGQGTPRSVVYYSRRLISVEFNYLIHNKEMLAIISCLRQWEAKLQSTAKPFSILSYHKNLSFFFVKRSPNEQEISYNELLH